METSAAEVLTRGMECLLEKMSIVDAERFLFLVKTEQFDYTKWQRTYFDGKTREQTDREMEEYFRANPEKVPPDILL
ncbi:MAG: hypothetical protein IKZ41_00780 [Clostridia bacterium]|nr:hypothetical protein [Clostridia bacterium]MBR5365570.1 hypothetical protein [Clostridia bacterium]